MKNLVTNTASLVFAVLFVSAALSRPSIALTIVNDNNPAFVYSLNSNINTPTSNWAYLPASNDYGGDEHSTNGARQGPAYQGASVSFTFTGTQVTWYGKKGPNYGYASVKLDFGQATIVNNYNSREIDQTALASFSGLANTFHVITINVLHQTQGSDYFQTVDYFTTDGVAVPLSKGTAAGWQNVHSLDFNPSVPDCPEGQGYINAAGWTCYGYLASDISGGQFWGGKAGATVTYTYTGSLIEMYGRPDAENGYFTVSIDGKAYGTYDANLGNVDDDMFNGILMFAAQTSNSTHTITVTTTGTNDGYYNASGNGTSGNLLQLDEFVSFGGNGSSPTPPPTPGSCQYQGAPQGPANQAPVTRSQSDGDGNLWDAGSILWSNNPAIILYPTVEDNLSQKFVWTQKSPGYTVCSSHSGEGCALNSNGSLIQGPTGDIFQMLAGTTSNSVTILDVTACGYVQRPSPEHGLTLGSTPTNWFIIGSN
jgi:hypothetical protein